MMPFASVAFTVNTLSVFFLRQSTTPEKGTSSPSNSWTTSLHLLDCIKVS